MTDPHAVVVLKDDSIVEVEGLRAGENILVEVKRGDVVVGSVEGRAANPGGTFIINHDVCWDRFTPQILARDVVEVTTAGGVDTVPVTDIEVTQGPVVVGSTFTIRGRVNQTPRPPVGELMVEARTNDPIRFRPLAPNLEPDDGEVRGEITYDGPTGGDFTATFTGLDAQQQEAANNLGEFFVSHVAGTSSTGELSEVTSASEGTGAPGPGCPPSVEHAVTDVSPTSINRANSDSPLTVSGVTVDATGVSVDLRDGDGTVVTRDAIINGAAGIQTWTATFPAAQLSALNGTIRVVGTYTPAGADGLTMTVLKDLVRPGRPSVSPDGGTYVRRQAVSLSAGRREQIRYTLGNGRQAAPTADTGRVYRGRQIRIASSQTLKAVAVDRAGNVSRVARHRYVIGAAAAPSRPRIRRALAGDRGGRDTATARWRAPRTNNGSRITGYRVTALKLRRNGSVADRERSPVLRPRARSHEMRLRSGRYQFRVRAVNAAGSSRMSARSNVVRAR